ncbi:hypothetical protein EJB05_26110, partial [Eragrostis curvula]
DARKQSPWTKDHPIRCKREIKIEGPKNVTWKVHPLLAEPGRDYRANKQLRQDQKKRRWSILRAKKE